MSHPCTHPPQFLIVDIILRVRFFRRGHSLTYDRDQRIFVQSGGAKTSKGWFCLDIVAVIPYALIAQMGLGK